ncbi:MAG: STAS domain-containing protein [Desulfomonilaceae bacterium]|nr:STAS domain-containing protein [Desulfomonilaceae bacterium]
MNITLTRTGDAAVIAVQGRVDTLSAPTVEQKLTQWLDEGETRMILDLSELEYISSAGLRTVLVIGKKAKANGGSLCCCALRGMVRKVFDVSGFSLVLPVYNTVDEALAAG